MNINLEKHHIAHIIPVIESRLKTIKRKHLKENRDNWSDYDDEGIEQKVIEKDLEYARLKQSLRIINQSTNF